MLHPPTQLALTGGDHFLYALDARMRRTGLGGNVCRIVLRLSGRLDGERLQGRLNDSPIIAWLAGTRLARRFPPLPPRWRCRPGLVPMLREFTDPSDSAEDLQALLRAVEGLDLHPIRGPLLCFHLAHHRGGSSSLILSWQHALLDVRGLELLLQGLDVAPRPDTESSNGDWFGAAQTTESSWRHWREGLRKARLARGSLRYTTDVCREPLFSLLDRPFDAGGRRNQYRVVELTEGQTARVDRYRDQLGTTLGASLFYLAASLQAVHRVASERDGEPAAYVVPVPHDLRRAGATGPVVSNQLTFLFYRIEPHLASDMVKMLEALAEQMVDQIRNGIPESFMAAMDISKPIPVALYLKWLSRPSRGKFASFFFSYAGESFNGLDGFLGAPVTSIAHFAPAALPPGLTLVFSRFRGRLSITLAWVEGYLSEDEVRQLEQGLRGSLRGEIQS